MTHRIVANDQDGKLHLNENGFNFFSESLYRDGAEVTCSGRQCWYT